MELTGFTFLNTTGAPKLSKPAAKRVRGHVTRINFANRRKRRAETGTRKVTAEPTHVTLTEQQLAVGHSELQVASHDAWDYLAGLLSAATRGTDRYRSAQLLNELWSVLLLGSRGTPGGADDLTWLKLLASEPALVEATMSMAVRCWSSKAPCRLRADFHSYRATNLLIQRIGSQDTYTDGFLGAAFTLALNERFLQNNEAWEVHMNGIIQSVRGRRSAGMDGLPPLFTDLVMEDVVNTLFDFPRIYHPILIKELTDHGNGMIATLDATTKNVAELRRMIHLHRKNPFHPDVVVFKIQQPWARLSSDLQRLADYENEYVRAAVTTIQLVLALSWPQKTDHLHCAHLANTLKDILEGRSARSCLFMDLSSCQIIVGAIAAERGSEARAWFVNKLQRALRAMEGRGWEKPFGILESALERDEHLLGRLRVLWNEEELDAQTTPSVREQGEGHVDEVPASHSLSL